MGFDPATASLIMMAAGTGLSAYGQYQEGKQADATAKYNQQVKEREAEAEIQRARVESRRQAQEAARTMASLRAGLGSSGVVTTEGTPLQLIGEQTRQSELDNQMIGYNAQTGAQKKREEGKQIRYQGKVAKQASRIGAGATLLTGFSTAFSGVGGGNKDKMLAKKHGISY